VEIYGRVRRAVRVEGRSRRPVAREFGLSRETARKMLQYAVPPGYQRQQPIKRPKLEPWVGVINAILEEDKQRPAKQRHTAKRIFERPGARVESGRALRRFAPYSSEFDRVWTRWLNSHLSNR
jgi:transposase